MRQNYDPRLIDIFEFRLLENVHRLYLFFFVICYKIVREFLTIL